MIVEAASHFNFQATFIASSASAVLENFHYQFVPVLLIEMVYLSKAAVE